MAANRVIWRSGRGSPGNVRPGAPQLEGALRQPNTLNLDPYNFPPPGARTFNLQVAQSIIGVGQVTTPAGLVLALPRYMMGVIHSVQLQLDGITQTTDVTWALLVNGVPIPGWGRVRVPGISGVAAAVQGWDVVRIELPLEAILSVAISDNDGGSYVATTSLYGWWWPVTR